MTQKILQAWGVLHDIWKDVFPALGKMNLFKLGKEWVLSLPFLVTHLASNENNEKNKIIY